MPGVSCYTKLAHRKSAWPLPDGQAELEDTQWGFGGNFGVLYELSDTTRFGLQYTTEIALDFEDTIDFSGLGPGMTTALQAAGRDLRGYQYAFFRCQFSDVFLETSSICLFHTEGTRLYRENIVLNIFLESQFSVADDRPGEPD